MGLTFRKTLHFGPLHVNLSGSGIGLSAGVRGARFGVDALGHPYTHLGRHGLYYRKRWPAVTTRPPVAPPTGHPPAGTHGRIGWGWILLLGLVVGLVVANLLGR